MLNIWRSELRINLRQRSYYSFFILWVTVISLFFLLQASAPSLQGYTNMTGTVVNIALYIIPLFMLITGSFSVANEMENGQWQLLSTYPLSTFSYITGKIGGQFISQLIVFTFSYGLSLFIGLLIGMDFSTEWLLSIYIFSIALMFFFLVIGTVIGCIVSTRWQALSISVILWFFLIMIWPVILITLLSLVPYTWIAPFLNFSIFINPAEFIRVSFVVYLEAGSVFGKAYDFLVTALTFPFGLAVQFLYAIVFLAVMLFVSTRILERKKRR